MENRAGGCDISLFEARAGEVTMGLSLLWTIDRALKPKSRVRQYIFRLTKTASRWQSILVDKDSARSPGLLLKPLPIYQI
jgi:hypothetical protein